MKILEELTIVHYISENVQFEHLGVPMTLQPTQGDYFSSRAGRRYEKQFYREKSSFDDGSSSYWPYSKNQPLPNYNTNPAVSLHGSFMKTLPINRFAGKQINFFLISFYDSNV